MSDATTLPTQDEHEASRLLQLLDLTRLDMEKAGVGA